MTEQVEYLRQLLAEDWLEYLGSGGRKTVSYDVPAEGREGPVPDRWAPLAIGKAAVRRTGSDLSIVGVGVGIHRAAAAADILSSEGISARVIDLRSVAPLYREAVVSDVGRTGRLLVVDEAYRDYGLSGELAATLLEAGLTPRYGRVALEITVNTIKRITFDPEVMRGKPCIRGMRVTVGMVVGLIASGHSKQDILELYPYLENEDIDEALRYAAWRVEEIEVPIWTGTA